MRPRLLRRLLPALLFASAATARPVTLDHTDADVRRVLRQIAAAGGINLVITDAVRGRVTVHLTAAPWRTALRVVTAAVGARAVPVGDAVVVRPR